MVLGELFSRDEWTFHHTVTPDQARNSFYLHSHNQFELLFFVSGDATQIIEDKKYKLKSGDLLLIRPSQYHFIQIDRQSRYERYDILFPNLSGAFFDENLIDGDLDIINLSSFPLAREIFQKIDYFSEHLPPDDFFQVLQLLTKELLYFISTLSKNTAITPSFTANPLLSRALKYINENIFSIKSMSEIADAVFVTESYLFRLFRDELKQTPKKYLLTKRLLYAQNFILSGELPTKVWQKCGFNDYTSFYRSYKTLFNKSPSQDTVKL